MAKRVEGEDAEVVLGAEDAGNSVRRAGTRSARARSSSKSSASRDAGPAWRSTG